MNNISVLTLVKGRGKALENMILGLCRSTISPDELIIILINEGIRKLPEAPFQIRQITLTTNKDLPLAEARNLAAQHAIGSLLVFLDVDCIPAANLLEEYHLYHQQGILLNGAVRYLHKDAVSDADFYNFPDNLSEPDPVRSDLIELPHELFWSLNFACMASDYQTIGGFDETFTGYGAEDTDFAFTARVKNIEMLKIAATAYHQYHESFSPPLNHFNDIIANARIFFLKWGRWPMEGWLKLFSDLELVKFDGQDLQIIRQPTDLELEQAKK